MTRNEPISKDELDAFFNANGQVKDNIKTKTGMRNTRQQAYNEIELKDPTAKFQQFGDTISQDHGRADRAKIATSRFTRTACRRGGFDGRN